MIKKNDYQCAILSDWWKCPSLYQVWRLPVTEKSIDARQLWQIKLNCARGLMGAWCRAEQEGVINKVMELHIGSVAGLRLSWNDKIVKPNIAIK